MSEGEVERVIGKEEEEGEGVVSDEGERQGVKVVEVMKKKGLEQLELEMEELLI